jgi:carbonic anhydrase
MQKSRPLPSFLIDRYRGWKATRFAENRSWYARLAEDGQRPRAMVIACCDSRVHVTSIFGADSGEFFIHRNIANLVPPYKPDGALHGTSAVIEYAVRSLRVANIIVLGHSQCGGVRGCHDMCRGHAPDLDEETSFVGRWMDLLRPGYDRVKGIADEPERLAGLEKEGVVISLGNLMTFPFVAAQVEAGHLDLHGAWHNIGDGSLWHHDPRLPGFAPV